MEYKGDAYYVAEVLKGNQNSFGPLVEQYKQLAYSLSFKVTGNREEAEEAAQDSFVKAYRSLESFQGRASFKTWFFRIVYTTAISRVRIRHSNTVSLDDYKLSDHDLLEAENAVGQLSAEERSFHLHRALDQLAADERVILNLFYFDDLTVEEIAIIMELSPSNVKIKLFRSRKKLYALLHRVLKTENSLVT